MGGFVKSGFTGRNLVMALLTGALITFSAPSAMAKPSTKERVTALEAEVAELKAAAAAATAASQRVDVLEQEVRSLTGRIETLNYQLQQADARLQSMSAALAGDTVPSTFNPALDGGFGSGNPAVPGGPTDLQAGPTDLLSGGAQTPSGDLGQQTQDAIVSDIQLPLDPEAAFAYSNGFLLRQDLPRAEASFTMFLSAFGGHPRAADAQFRLGEIYLAQDKFAEAADTFVEFVRKYPNSGRSAEAYLKLGAAFAGLGETEEACKVLRAVKSRYPNAEPQVLDRADRELRRHNCS